MAIRKRSSALFLLPLLLPPLCWPVALATEVAGPDDSIYAVDEDASLEDRRRVRAAELEAIRRSMQVSERRQVALDEEIHGLEADQTDLTAELIATAQRMRAAENEIQAVESRLMMLHAREDVMRASLKQRRSVMAEVLMALQRMGQTPPPAILSRPEDALAAIRGSILAGAVLPDIRGEAEVLAADLGALARLTAEIGSERDSLRANYTALGEEQARIDLLVASKQAQRDQTQAALAAEQGRASELAGQAESVQSLIDSMEQDIAAAEAAAEQQETAAREAAEAADAEAERTFDTRRIAPAMQFAEARGHLMLPVAGETVLRFGETDSIGEETQGMSIAARAEAPVLAPADGWVVYAGPFRSYGQVLILNAGDDYHIVMAGMERIDVALRQFVLAGEPVATMGATRLASIAEIDHTSAQPVLYVEFRKDGTAIDPAPWWAAATDDEVNG